MLMLSLTKCRSCIINIHFGAFTLYSLSNYWYAFSNVTNYCNKDHWITFRTCPWWGWIYRSDRKLHSYMYIYLCTSIFSFSDTRWPPPERWHPGTCVFLECSHWSKWGCDTGPWCSCEQDSFPQGTVLYSSFVSFTDW